MTDQEFTTAYNSVCQSAALITGADITIDSDNNLMKYCVDIASEYLIMKTDSSITKEILFSDFKTSCALAGVYFYNVFNKNSLAGVDYADFGNIKIKTDKSSGDNKIYLLTALEFLKDYIIDDDFAFTGVEG